MRLKKERERERSNTNKYKNIPNQQTFWKVVCTPYVSTLINPCSYKNKDSVKTPSDNYIASFIPVTLFHTI